MVRHAWRLIVVYVWLCLPALAGAQVSLSDDVGGVFLTFPYSDSIWLADFYQPVTYDGSYWSASGASVSGSAANDRTAKLRMVYQEGIVVDEVSAGTAEHVAVASTVLQQSLLMGVANNETYVTPIGGQIIASAGEQFPQFRYPGSTFTLDLEAGEWVVNWYLASGPGSTLLVAKFKNMAYRTYLDSLGSGDVLAELQAMHSTLSAFREAFDTQLGTLNTNVSVLVYYMQSVSGTLNTVSGTTFEIRDLVQELVDTFAPGGGPVTTAAGVYTSPDPIIKPISGTAAVDTYEGVLSEHGLAAPTWTTPITPAPGMQFTVSMAAIRSGFGFNIPDFNIGMGASTLTELQPYIVMVHTVFLAGLTIWGMGRVWQEMRVH